MASTSAAVHARTAVPAGLQRSLHSEALKKDFRQIGSGRGAFGDDRAGEVS